MTSVHKSLLEGFVENLLDKGASAVEVIEATQAEAIFDEGNEREVEAMFEEDGFGIRLLRQEALNEFKSFCEEREYCVTQMRSELDRSKYDIIDETDEKAVELIEEYIQDFEECPVCQNDLLYNSEEDVQYCPMCVTDEL